jgi:aminocarboxymuconate-semialdehyde decarboxylase
MFDTTLAIEGMIFDGFLDRHPDLKLIAAHGGGALPYLVGRMTATPTDYLRRLWYDCITYDLGALRYLISVVGADRVLFGTDWPYQVHVVVGISRQYRRCTSRPARCDPWDECTASVRAVVARYSDGS